MNSINIDHNRFEQAKIKVLLGENGRHGFGTLKEKTIHQVMKLYYAPNEDVHEVPIEGLIADIYTGEEIIEIQNGNFNKLRHKLSRFLPQYQVVVVYPIPYQKWIIWMDEETGELIKKRKSTKTGTGYEAFKELYRIKSQLKHPNLHFRFPLVNMEEYRLLNGWSADKKKGSSRYDRIPISLEEEIIIDQVADYLQFVPYDLEDGFTNQEFARKARIPVRLSGIVVNILFSLDILERVGKKGNAYLYAVKA